MRCRIISLFPKLPPPSEADPVLTLRPPPSARLPFVPWSALPNDDVRVFGLLPITAGLTSAYYRTPTIVVV